jgi:hypothetical protein
MGRQILSPVLSADRRLAQRPLICVPSACFRTKGLALTKRLPMPDLSWLSTWPAFMDAARTVIEERKAVLAHALYDRCGGSSSSSPSTIASARAAECATRSLVPAGVLTPSASVVQVPNACCSIGTSSHESHPRDVVTGTVSGDRSGARSRTAAGMQSLVRGLDPLGAGRRTLQSPTVQRRLPPRGRTLQRLPELASPSTGGRSAPAPTWPQRPVP